MTYWHWIPSYVDEQKPPGWLVVWYCCYITAVRNCRDYRKVWQHTNMISHRVKNEQMVPGLLVSVKNLTNSKSVIAIDTKPEQTLRLIKLWDHAHYDYHMTFITWPLWWVQCWTPQKKNSPKLQHTLSLALTHAKFFINPLSLQTAYVAWTCQCTVRVQAEDLHTWMWMLHTHISTYVCIHVATLFKLLGWASQHLACT